MTTQTAWIPPKKFFADKKLTFKVGDQIDPAALGMPENPTYGPLPVLTVTDVKENGELLAGTIVCTEMVKEKVGDTETIRPCGEVVTVHLGDYFQKRRCERCQRRVSSRNSRSKLSEGERDARAAQRAAEKAERDRKKAEAKAARQAEFLEKQRKQIEERSAKAEAEAKEKLRKAEEALQKIRSGSEATTDGKVAVA